jgi:hypothetical protein
MFWVGIWKLRPETIWRMMDPAEQINEIGGK